MGDVGWVWYIDQYWNGDVMCVKCIQLGQYEIGIEGELGDDYWCYVVCFDVLVFVLKYLLVFFVVYCWMFFWVVVDIYDFDVVLFQKIGLDD